MGPADTETPEHTDTAPNGDPPSSPRHPKSPPPHPAGRSRRHHPPPPPTPGLALPPPQRDRAAGPGAAGRAALANSGPAGGAAPINPWRPASRGRRKGQEADVPLEATAWRGTPALPEIGAAGSWGGGVPELVLTPRAPPPPSLCLGPPAPIPLPWQAPTSCSRARGASVGAPHGAASPPPRRARPAQSARPPRPQSSPAPRGARAGRQRGWGPAGARARPMVPGVRTPRSPLPRSFSASTKKEEEARKREREMIKLLEAGCWRSPEAEQGRVRARGGRWKLPPRRPGGGEEKEGFGGNEGDLKSRPAVSLHLPSSRRRAALCCPLLPPAGSS